VLPAGFINILQCAEKPKERLPQRNLPGADAEIYDAFAAKFSVS